MKVACIQSSAGENYNKNFKQIVKLINQSIKNKADLIITPETTSLITSDKKILYKNTFKMNADPLINKTKEWNEALKEAMRAEEAKGIINKLKKFIAMIVEIFFIF